MKNKNNIALLAEIQSDFQGFLRFALKVCKRPEVAEDVVQDVMLKLLRKEINFEIENNRKFLLTMIFQTNLNHWKVNRRYVSIGDIGASNPDFDENTLMDTLVQNFFGCSYQEDIEYSFKLKSIRKEAQTLPEKQKHAIMQALAGHEVGVDLGDVDVSKVPQYESLKTNKRLAIQKLKLKLA